MKRILYTIVLISCCLAGCSKDEIDPYGKTDYIFFSNDTATTIEYSFAFNPGVEKDTVGVILKLVGRVTTDNRPIALSVDPAYTTALSSDYKLPDNIVLRAGYAADTIPLILHKTARLQTAKFKIRLVLHENGQFLPGPPANRYLNILFSDMIARPGWWNNIVTTNFLGTYSDTKYRLFIEATGIADMTGLSENSQRAYAIIFRDFLARGREQGEVYEDENGQIDVSPNLR